VRGETLVDRLGDLLGGGEASRPGIVHRLDKDTSGLMVIARDAEAHRRLSAMVKARELQRTYLALVEGRPRSRSGTIDAPLGRASPGRRAPRRGCAPPRAWPGPPLRLRGQQPQSRQGSKMAVPGQRALLEADLHFAHQPRRWNPRMQRYIWGERDGIHIVDLL